MGDVGMKHDSEKLRYDLIPPDFLESLATILTMGAKKYAPWNWSKGFDWSRLYSATQRHLNAWWNGEDKDPESGHSHLWHAGCCITFLIVHEMRHLGKDDRDAPAWFQHRETKLRNLSKGPALVPRQYCRCCGGSGKVQIKDPTDLTYTLVTVDCGECT